MYNQGNTVAPKQLSETQYAAQVLDQTISYLEARVAELQSRLTPVLEDRPQGECGADCKAERQMFSTLGRGIIETSYRIEDITRRVNNMLDTLAI